MPEKNPDTAIILFDGICNFCNSSVNAVIRHDKKNYFRFAALQSESGKNILEKYTADTAETDSIVLIENNKVYTKSSAALRITRHLNGIYPLLYLFIIVPPFIRNFVYDFIARNRYKWFGKREVCMIPTQEIKDKFIF